MIFGTLVFSDSLARPSYLDTDSVDYEYPLPSGVPVHAYDTRSVRKCYRSKQIQLPIHSTFNGTVFLHNVDALVAGNVRLYLWKKHVSRQLLDTCSGLGWTALGNSTYAHASTLTSPLTSSNSFTAGTTYQLQWELDLAPGHGHITISIGGVLVQVVNATNTVTTQITRSGSVRLQCASTAPLVVTPVDGVSSFNGTIKLSVALPYDVRPLQIQDKDFLEVECRTRTVTKGVAVGSVQINDVFESAQVVVLQPCTGVSLYMGPSPNNPGPSVGPSI